LSFLLLSLSFVIVLSVIEAGLTRRRANKELVVEPRVWSERQRAYKDPTGDKGDLMSRGWRCATTEEVRERRAELVNFLADKTLNIFKMSKCQGLAVPQAKLQDGVISPKIQFQTEEDVGVLSTQDPEFKTFENLYGLRFTRYVILIKEKFK